MITIFCLVSGTAAGIPDATQGNLGKRNGLVFDCVGGYGILVYLLQDKGIEALQSAPCCPFAAEILAYVVTTVSSYGLIFRKDLLERIR